MQDICADKGKRRTTIFAELSEIVLGDTAAVRSFDSGTQDSSFGPWRGRICHTAVKKKP